MEKRSGVLAELLYFTPGSLPSRAFIAAEAPHDRGAGTEGVKIKWLSTVRRFSKSRA